MAKNKKDTLLIEEIHNQLQNFGSLYAAKQILEFTGQDETPYFTRIDTLRQEIQASLTHLLESLKGNLPFSAELAQIYARLSTELQVFMANVLQNHMSKDDLELLKTLDETPAEYRPIVSQNQAPNAGTGLFDNNDTPLCQQASPRS